MYPANPTMPADPMVNPLIPTFEQMTFIYTYYPEYAQNPVDMIVYLYQMAQWQEDQMRLQQMESEAYTKPSKGGRKVNAGKRGKD